MVKRVVAIVIVAQAVFDVVGSCVVLTRCDSCEALVPMEGVVCEALVLFWQGAMRDRFLCSCKAFCLRLQLELSHRQCSMLLDLVFHRQGVVAVKLLF